MLSINRRTRAIGISHGDFLQPAGEKADQRLKRRVKEHQHEKDLNKNIASSDSFCLKRGNRCALDRAASSFLFLAIASREALSNRSTQTDDCRSNSDTFEAQHLERLSAARTSPALIGSIA
jgi:hypothetical protein